MGDPGAECEWAGVVVVPCLCCVRHAAVLCACLTVPGMHRPRVPPPLSPRADAPPITFVVVQKRHHSRIFPMPQDQQNRDRSGNVLPGERAPGWVPQRGQGLMRLQPFLALLALLGLLAPPPACGAADRLSGRSRRPSRPAVQAPWWTAPSPTPLSSTST